MRDLTNTEKQALAMELLGLLDDLLDLGEFDEVPIAGVNCQEKREMMKGQLRRWLSRLPGGWQL